MLDIAISGETILECDHVRAKDKLRALDDVGYCGLDLPLYLLMLSPQVEKGYHKPLPSMG